MGHNDLEGRFPRLRDEGYQITSPEDITYNCVAWAAGCDTRWWEPTPDGYWPVATRLQTVDCYVSAFRSLGYEICEGAAAETGFEKIAIYANGEYPTHAARQLPDGQWMSKCGDLEDIEHALEGLEDSDYGKVRVVMKRRVASRADHE